MDRPVCQWNGFWRDTLSGLELLVSGTQKADIMACGFRWDGMLTANNCYCVSIGCHTRTEDTSTEHNSRKSTSKATKSTSSRIMGRHFFLLFFTYYNICTYVPELTIVTSGCIRYSGLDQLYPTCNFVVS
jgi:hypothetical protein